MSKRSAKWAVIRKEAPVMPWDSGEPMAFGLADALRRVAAIRGTATVAFFYLDVSELSDRLTQASNAGHAPLHREDAETIIRGHYAELVELKGRDHAQRFVRLWLMLSHYLERVEKGAIARAALKRQVARVGRR